jgi:hypothetical protein
LPPKETSDKLITAIASDLDPEEEHHKEKSPWDMSSNDDEEEETYQTEGKPLYTPTPSNDNLLTRLPESLREWTDKTKQLLKQGLAATRA